MAEYKSIDMISWLTIMQLTMLQLRDLPTAEGLKKFAQRYPEADVSAIATFLHLLRVATDLSTALDECLQRHGLLQGRWWVLILLLREETRVSTPSVLAEKSGVARATMTGLIDGLERDGLVERVFDPADRRRVSVKLTDSGQDKLDEVMPDYYSQLQRCMAGLDETGRDDLRKMLKLIQRDPSA